MLDAEGRLINYILCRYPHLSKVVSWSYTYDSHNPLRITGISADAIDYCGEVVSYTIPLEDFNE